MHPLHPLAAAANSALQSNPVLFSLLSERGKRIYFPKTGILGQTAEAKGKGLNATIGIGLEDDGSPMILSSIAESVSLDPVLIVPYAPGYGVAELRSQWQKQMRVKNPSLTGTISLPVVTGGLTHSLCAAAFLFADPGDKVIVGVPCWDNYGLLFESASGARLDPFPLFEGDGFNIAGFRTMLADHPGKQIILLNFPNNPTGYTPTVSEVQEIIDAIRESAERGNRIVVLLDDAYFGLFYEENVYKESLFAPLSNLHENVLAVKIDGISKEDFAWGLRIGFLTYAAKGMTDEMGAALADKTAGAIRGSLSNAPLLSQTLVLKAMESPGYAEEKREKGEKLRKRFEAAKRAASDQKYREYFQMLPANSGYFFCLQPQQGLDAEKIRKILLEEFDTGVIALGPLLRIAFSSVPMDQMNILFENVAVACGKLQRQR